ncbi:MAG: hypothetical protein M1839_004222 [Geoglossum umbratile]|nr:MAG: hypothetical protein M1839_004222 [Geoglossum umbratile]
MAGSIAEAQPTKRQKLSPNSDTEQALRTDRIASQISDFAQQDMIRGPGREALANIHRLKEMEVGIVAYIDDAALGFSGIVKKRYTDFLVNEILPSGQVLHLESLDAPSQPGQVRHTQKRHNKTVKTDTEAVAANRSSSGTIDASASPMDSLQKNRADAIAAWGRLPAQLAQDDAQHRKKQLAEYAAYKAREGLVDPQSNIPKGNNKDFSTPNANVRVAKSPGPRSDTPEHEGKETLTSSAGKDVAIAPDLQEEIQEHNRETLKPADKIPTESLVVGAEADGKNGFQLPAEDESLLLTFFSPTVLKEILALYNNVLASKDTKGAPFGKIKSDMAMERAQRTQLHQSMRRIFSSRLETETSGDGAIIVSVSGSSSRGRWGTMSHQTQRTAGPQPKRKSVWEERGGEYLHFTLYKENKDTMEVVSFLAKHLRIQPRSLQFAGTKDRRAVTVQRISAYRLDAQKLAGMNKILYGSRIGGFEYRNEGLSLGDLAGNEFVITLRDCKFQKTEGMDFQEKLQVAKSAVKDSILMLEQNGFLNYYGLQRFGTFSTGTHEVGVRMLQGNFEDACQKILSFSPEALAAAENPQTILPVGSMISSDDVRRAIALDLFKTTGKGKEALERLPRKFSAETAVIRHLSHEKTSADWQGALQAISRPLRLMYVHAYQSFIWNIVAGERWKRWGGNVVGGDLVLICEHGGVEVNTDELEEEDESGEVVIHAQSRAGRGKGEQEFERARPLSDEEAASGNYSIFDVVLPTPGFDIAYPANSLADFYKEFMGSERGGGLDPCDMRRAWKDVSLSGSYRKLVGRAKGLEFDVKPYVEENEQMVMTDLERLKQKTRDGNSITTAAPTTATADAAIADADSDPEEGGGVVLGAEHGGDNQRKIAVVVKFQLGTSQYATMALRELMKDGGAVAYKPEFSGGK